MLLNAEEYIKCEKDFVYFVENYLIYEITNNQKDLLKLLKNENYIIILNKTVPIIDLIKFYIIYLCLFNKDVKIGVISNDPFQYYNELMETFDKLCEFFPIIFKRKQELSFVLKDGNKCYIKHSRSNISKIFLGYNLTNLIIDKAAYIQDIEKIFNYIIPILPSNKKRIIIQSNENRNKEISYFFDNQYKISNEGKSLFKPFITD